MLPTAFKNKINKSGAYKKRFIVWHAWKCLVASNPKRYEIKIRHGLDTKNYFHVGLYENSKLIDSLSWCLD